MASYFFCLEFLKEFHALGRSAGGVDLENIVANSLRQGAALADGHLVTILDTESGRRVGGEVGVALLITLVLANIVEIIAANDDGALHLRRVDNTLEDAAADVDIGSEGALLVDIGSLHGLLGRAESQANVLPKARLAALALLGQHLLAGLEDTALLLESFLDLRKQINKQTRLVME